MSDPQTWGRSHTQSLRYSHLFTNNMQDPMKLLLKVYSKIMRYFLSDKIFVCSGYGEYFMMIERFKISLPGNPILVEVGSLDGRDSIQLSKHFDCHVHCFEPNPVQIPKVLKNISDAGLHDRITLYPFAISCEPGVVDFWYSGENNPGASSLYQLSDNHEVRDHTSAHDQIRMSAECIRLDDWMDANEVTRIDLLFMDCQGSELQVLKSLGSKIDKIDNLILEGQFVQLYDDTPTIWEINDFLVNRGFELLSKNLIKIPGMKFNNFYYKRS